MFTCNACLRRALRALAKDLPSNVRSFHHHQDTPAAAAAIATATSIAPSQTQSSPARTITRTTTRSNPPTLRLHTHHHQHHPALRRTHATLAFLQKSHHRRDLANLRRDPKKQAGLKVPRTRKGGVGAFSKPALRDAQARAKNRVWFAGTGGAGRDGVRGRAREEDEDDEEEDEDEDEEEHDSGDGDGDLVRPSEMKELSKHEQKLALKAQQEDEAARREDNRLMRKAQRDVETYYKDPLQLANAVSEHLRNQDIDAALRLVRAGDAIGGKNIVSWNHCMDWFMGQGNVSGALRVYNDLKKRGHKPDAHTYTIMLRGFSDNVKTAHRAVKEAVKIYSSIYAPNSGVKPNIIHTNAVINVCARGNNMDSLWAVIAKMPERGAGSPDRLTYTTILNAIRENTIHAVAKTADYVSYRPNTTSDQGAEQERKRLFNEALANGRKLWEDVSYKWRRADMTIDEYLVCAMGRLLTGCGIGSDFEQVLDLVEQTMNVRIPERKARVAALPPPGQEEEQTEQVNYSGSALPLKESTVYATPTQRTLSLLMEACFLHKRIAHLAPSYWHALTNTRGPFKIEPDAGNVTAYLRVLRFNRASERAYELLSQPYTPETEKIIHRRASYILAFAACARDKNNPNVFKTARKLLNLMQERLTMRAQAELEEQQTLWELKFLKRRQVQRKQLRTEKAMTDEERAELERIRGRTQALPIDPKILNYYLQLALTTTKGWNEGIRGKDEGEVFERDPAKNHTMIALREIEPHIVQAKSLLKIKVDEMSETSSKAQRLSRSDRVRAAAQGQESSVGEDTDDMLALLKLTISAIDKVDQVADRFKRGRNQPLNPEFEGYNNLKRETNLYMNRIETHMRKLNPTQKDKHSSSTADDEDVELAEPEISRRIKTVLGEVDGKILKEKSRGYKPPSAERPLKIASRVEKHHRLRLLDQEMHRFFPVAESVLDEEGQLVSDPKEKAKLENRKFRHQMRLLQENSTSSSQQPRTAQYDAESFEEPPSAKSQISKSNKKQREPMIGDELGLDDEDDLQDSEETTSRPDALQAEVPQRRKHDVPFEPRIRRITEAASPFPQNGQYHQASMGNSASGTRSIALEPEVRRVWGEQKRREITRAATSVNV